MLCHTCNTTGSQAYDRAYENFSNWLADQGEELLSFTEIDFTTVYGREYQDKVLCLLKYMVKHLGCRIADKGRAVPAPLRAALAGIDLRPFEISFAKNPIWRHLTSAEKVLINHELGVFIDSTEEARYISGFSVGYMTFTYRYNHSVRLPWEGDMISGCRRRVKLGTYQRPKRVFRIDDRDFEIRLPSIDEAQDLLHMNWPSEGGLSRCPRFAQI